MQNALTQRLLLCLCILAGSAAVMTTVGCKDDGPAEEVGEELDEAGDEIKEAGEEVKDEMEE